MLNEQVLEDWDEDDEARENAEAEANALAHRDPETAALLRLHIQASQQRQARKQHHQEKRVHEKVSSFIDVLELHARISEFFPWMSDEIALKMHYPRFFRYAELAKKMAQERKNAAKQPANHAGNAFMEQLQEAQLARLAGQAQHYTGETVAIRE